MTLFTLSLLLSVELGVLWIPACAGMTRFTFSFENKRQIKNLSRHSREGGNLQQIYSDNSRVLRLARYGFPLSPRFREDDRE